MFPSYTHWGNGGREVRRGVAGEEVKIVKEELERSLCIQVPFQVGAGPWLEHSSFRDSFAHVLEQDFLYCY